MKSLVLTISVLVSGLVFGQDCMDMLDHFKEEGYAEQTNLREELEKFGGYQPTIPSGDVRYAKSFILWDTVSIMYTQYSFINPSEPYNGIISSLEEVRTLFEAAGYSFDTYELAGLIYIKQQETMESLTHDKKGVLLENDDFKVHFLINRHELMLNMDDHRSRGN